MSSMFLQAFETPLGTAHPPQSSDFEQVVTGPHVIEPCPFDVPALLRILET